MSNFLIILIIITCVLLLLIVLAQNPKGGGLSSAFGGGGGNQIMGAKKTTDFLEKTTWTLVIALIILSLATNYIAISKSKKSNPIKGIENTLPETNNKSQSTQ